MPKQQTVSSLWLANKSCTPQQAAVITYSILNMLVTDMRPISMVEDDGFIAMVHALHPGYTLPSRTHFTKRMEAKYAETFQKSQEPKSLPDGIFAGTKITPEVLVQSLMIEGPVDVPKPAKTGAEVKKIRSKKEKMKERRERWLNKISSIKKAKEQKAAEEQRKATPVVGDMRVLADALPELSQLIAPTTSTAHRKNRKTKVPVKRKEPTDYSQMKQSQKRKLLETEMIRFGDAVKSLTSKSNPLSDIGEQLKKRMRQEEEPVPS